MSDIAIFVGLVGILIGFLICAIGYRIGEWVDSFTKLEDKISILDYDIQSLRLRIKILEEKGKK